MSDKNASMAPAPGHVERDPASGAPLAPKHPARICWGCDKYCPENDLACGNGTIRTPHPIELFGEDWLEWSSARSDRRSRPG
jgi:hypothetical protein